MQTYQVTHKESGERFYVLAASSAEAIEKVTLQIADVEGSAAWTAQPDASHELSAGVVLDASGKPIRTMNT